MRKTGLVGVAAFALCVVAGFLVPLGVSAKKTSYDANHVHWREGENCAFSPSRAGDNLPWGGPTGGGEVIDIREMYDPQRNNIVVGVVYLTSLGKKIYEVNPYFPFEKRARLNLLHSTEQYWSGGWHYDEKSVGFPERECQTKHLGNGINSSFVILDQEYRIYSAGADPVPQGTLSAKTLTRPFIDEEKDYGK